MGTMALAKGHPYSYSPEDMEFLHSSASQVGIAAENLRLLEQVLRSQRQWMNTFDSIQDAILAHDADFVITKANEALLQHLGLAPADLMGNTCEDALPTISRSGPSVRTVHGETLILSKARIRALADIPWCRPHPITEQGKPAEGHDPCCPRYDRPARGEKSTACCSSRRSKACSLRPRRASCSIAMTLS